MNEITRVTIHNPFNRGDREIKKIEHKPGRTVRAYIEDLTLKYPDQKFVISVNGHVVPEKEIETALVAAGSYVSACPVVAGGGGGGKNTLGMIAGIALAVVSMGVGSLVSGGAFFGSGALAMASWSWAGFLAAAAVMYLGGMLLNHMFPQPKVEIPDVEQTAQTYAWSTPQPLIGQGYSLGLVYGTIRPTPILVGQHITTDGDNQFLNMLLSVGDGPIDSIDDVRINDNPTANFTGVTIEKRYGTNEQTVISNFNDSYADTALNLELVDGFWQTNECAGNTTEALEIEITCPSGLYHVNDDGALSDAWTEIDSQYKLHSAEIWQNWLIAEKITAKSSSAVRRAYCVGGLTPGQYDVRVVLQAVSGETTRDVTSTYWTRVSEIVYDDFGRPGKALLGIKALATNQLSGGMPNISCTVTRSKIWAYNPTAAAYQEKDADNPAWAAYDLIHRAKQLHDVRDDTDKFVIYGVPAAQIIYQDFDTWAAFCGTKSLEFNYFLEKATDLWSALKPMEGIGRGKVILRGTKFGAICDAPSSAVQLFTVGNIIHDTFREEFLATKDRANSVEVSFFNADKGYQRDVLAVYTDDWNSSTAIKNPTQIMLDGVTSLALAYQEAKYRLRLNQYLIRTVSFEAATDAIACQVGDVIYVQHDVPQWGYGGRVISATSDTVTLDQAVTLAADTTYSILIRINATDAIVQKTIAPDDEERTLTTLTVTVAFTTTPAADDVYSFGEVDVEAKPFRVVNISRATELTRRISALEYRTEVYGEATDVPTVTYTALEPYYDVTNLTVGQETYAKKGGAADSRLYISFDMPRNKSVSKYLIYLSTDSGTTWWKETETTLTSITLFGMKPLQAYKVRVHAVNEVGTISAGVTSSEITITGKDIEPPDVADFTATADTVNLAMIRLAWSPVSCNDLYGYEIKESGNVIAAAVTDTKYIHFATTSREYNFSIRAIDNSGNYSVTPDTASLTVVVDYIPPAITLTATPDVINGSKVITGDVTFSIAIIEADGIPAGGCHLYLNGTEYDITLSGSAPNYTGSKVFEDLSTGDYACYVKAIDNSNNISTSQTVNFSVDAATPASLDAPTLVVRGRTVQITLPAHTQTANFDHYDYYYSINNWSNSVFAKSSKDKTIEFTFSQDYETQVRVKAVQVKTTGTGGVLANATSSAAFWIDATPPVVTIASVTNVNAAGWTKEDSTTVTFSATDTSGSGVASYAYSLNGGAWSAATNPQAINISATEGANLIKIKATDNAGNSAEAQYTIWRDVTKPADVTSFAGTFRRKLLLTWAASTDSGSGIAGYEIRSADSNWGSSGFLYRGFPSSLAYEYTPGSSADVTLYIRAFDAAGNYSNASANMTAANVAPANVGTVSTQSEISAVIFSWPVVTTDANAAATDDIEGYSYRTKVGSAGDWSDLIVTKANSIFRALVGSERTQADRTIYIEVKAVNVWGKLSATAATANAAPIYIEYVNMGNNPMQMNVWKKSGSTLISQSDDANLLNVIDGDFND